MSCELLSLNKFTPNLWLKCIFNHFINRSLKKFLSIFPFYVLYILATIYFSYLLFLCILHLILVDCDKSPEKTLLVLCVHAYFLPYPHVTEQVTLTSFSEPRDLITFELFYSFGMVLSMLEWPEHITARLLNCTLLFKICLGFILLNILP